MHSIIRYFGGKGNGLCRIIYQCFPLKSEYEIYLEAFGGGASILLYKEPFGIEIYNDLEKNVYSLFKVLSNKDLFTRFKELCDLSYYSLDLRNEYKKDLKNDQLDILERAYKFFYINRTSVNGLGGFSVATCIRRNMSKSVSDMLTTIDDLPAFHNRLSRVIIENTDGIELIKKYDRDKVFMYLDPPYAHETRTETRYAVDMDDKQQKQLIDVLLGLKCAKVLLSGYDCKEYDRLVHNGWDKIQFKVKTQDGNRKPKIKTEILWKNYKGRSGQPNTLWN